MISQIIKRLLAVIPHLLIVTIVLFFLIHLLPGNAATMILGDSSSSIDQLQQLESQMGFDQPVHIQYLQWLKNILLGDLGTSYLTGYPVANRIAERLPVTLELISLSILLAILIGIPIGIICAVKRNSAIDYFFSTILTVGIAMPAFWAGMLMIIVFAINLNILPASGYVPFSQNPLMNLKHMILPVVATSISLMSTIARQTRSAMLDVLGQDFIMTAHSKGMKWRKIYYKHALNNALIPIITSISIQISTMIGGSVVVEAVFILPGMGKSMIDAIFQRDYPIVMGEALVIAILIVVLYLFVDIIYAVVDPRISYNQKK